MGTGWRAARILALLAGLLPVALVAAAIRYAHGCPPAELTREALRIDSRFYGMNVARTGVDVGRARGVDLEAEPE